MSKKVACELCEREGLPTTKHHVIPRKVHKNKWFRKNFSREAMNETIDLCKNCHRQIHLFFSHKDLARKYHSVELLLEEERVKNYVEWIRKRG
ncbi:MAG: hypothetical protein MRZ79_25960 [Bacteroidia bacterium]|nr:hypothetical protein [Bacteroidia bacterium]